MPNTLTQTAFGKARRLSQGRVSQLIAEGLPIAADGRIDPVSADAWLAKGDGKTASFHISALYSPFVSWGETALEHAVCAKDPARLQTWTNCSLGETWEDRASILPEPARLMARASSWGEMVPDGVVVLTGAADVQMDRLEVEIVGWVKGEESWSLEYHTLPGNPAEPDVWQRLDEITSPAAASHPGCHARHGRLCRFRQLEQGGL